MIYIRNKEWNIPDYERVLGVMGEHLVEKREILMDSTVDMPGISINDTDCIVSVVVIDSEASKKMLLDKVDTTRSDGMTLLDWNISSEVTIMAGNIDVYLMAEWIDPYGDGTILHLWKSELETFTILDSADAPDNETGDNLLADATDLLLQQCLKLVNTSPVEVIQNEDGSFTTTGTAINPVIVTQVREEGEEIARINGQSIYAPVPESSDLTAHFTSGTKVATIGDTDIYVPDVEVEQVATSGTEIAVIGGVSIYAPANSGSSGSGSSSSTSTTPTYTTETKVVDTEIAFKTSSTYYKGWKKGYYGESDGALHTGSGYYLFNYYKFNATNYPNVENGATIIVTPPEGYGILVYEYGADDNYIGNISTTSYTERLGQPVTFTYDNTHSYAFTIARFSDANSGDYVNDQAFLDQCTIVQRKTVTIQVPVGGTVDETGSTGTVKLENTAKSIYFSVKVPKKLPYGDEEATDATVTVECILRLPKSYTAVGKPTRLVYAAHGASGYILKSTNIWYNEPWNDLMDSLNGAGYAVFDTNVLPGTNTDQIGKCNGSSRCVAIVHKAYQYILDNYNVYPQIFVHGTSMGGVAASAFSHCYPQLVLAESSFAGRDMLMYMSQSYSGESHTTGFIKAYDYASESEMKNDGYSHWKGLQDSMSLIRIKDGKVTAPPSINDNPTGWLKFFHEIYTCDGKSPKTADLGTIIGHRTVPYKSWNSWEDNVKATKLDQTLMRAYNTGGSCVYEAITYDSGTHSQMCYGKVNNMTKQLIAWYRRWE